MVADPDTFHRVPELSQQLGSLFIQIFKRRLSISIDLKTLVSILVFTYFCQIIIYITLSGMKDYIKAVEMYLSMGDSR